MIGLGKSPDKTMNYEPQSFDWYIAGSHLSGTTKISFSSSKDWSKGFDSTAANLLFGTTNLELGKIIISEPHNPFWNYKFRIGQVSFQNHAICFWGHQFAFRNNRVHWSKFDFGTNLCWKHLIYNLKLLEITILVHLQKKPIIFWQFLYKLHLCWQFDVMVNNLRFCCPNCGCAVLVVLSVWHIMVLIQQIVVLLR